ncbi:nacht and wd40 domain-containing protein [Moniliophthora roreri MCA 2997]|uniref:Nacht and wd40 domain-containing protein n=1 Tax=Moniliophthora roreri (strain MCA 2997) TaxID=1381753 RepID=V2XI64_MONRO|nr:nacht and wd40 domain-containing protein [Moniliophthora roreri MCA 2997]
MFNRSRGATIWGDAHNNVGRDQSHCNNAYEVHGNVIHNVYSGGISPNLDDPISKDTLRLLAEKAAPNACYDSEQRFPPPNCHPGTRAEILAKLSQWIEGERRSSRVFWLYGSAGVGKSAIAQNLAEKFTGRKIAASFFFSRSDTSRDKLEPFVASLAYQLCKLGSPLKPVLGRSKVESEAFQKLPNTVTIDGLDECVQHPSQERLLAIIRKPITSPTHTPWVFLIFSRPEPQIRCAFDHEDFDRVLMCLAITPSAEATRDIRKYMVDCFADLRKKHRALRYEGTSWPSEDAIDKLVDRADGQFIFASTVIKFVDTHDERPQDRLETILRIYVDHGVDSPYSDLDLLYHQILSACHQWEKVQRVLRLLVTPHKCPRNDSSWKNSWHSPAMVALQLHLKHGEVEAILSRLHSVLQIPEYNTDNIHITHASFTEFLSDPNCSGKYHTPEMSKLEYYDLVATLLLHTLSTMKVHYPLYQLQSEVTTAFPLWNSMLRDQDTDFGLMSAHLFAALSCFDPYSFLSTYIFFQGINLHSPFWRDTIKWAKSFGESTLQFVGAWEPFLWGGFCVAFPPKISKQLALEWTFHLEESFLNGYTYHVDTSRKIFLQRLYFVIVEVSTIISSWGGHTLLILPADSHMILPEGWHMTHITKHNEEVFHRVLNVMGQDDMELLLDDIQMDTCEILIRKLVREDDLAHLKSFLKERRKEVIPQANDWLYRPFSGEGALTV